MSRNPFDDDWVPAQVKKPEIIDLRSIAYGPRGYKVKNKDKFGNKNEEGSNLMEVDSNEVPLRLSANQLTRTNKLGNGKISKRVWKVPGKPACSLKLPYLSKSLEEINSERASKRLFRQTKREIKEARGARLKEIRERRQKSLEKKKENQMKSAVVQKISNAKTLKKMMSSKKQSKKLVMSAN